MKKSLQQRLPGWVEEPPPDQLLSSRLQSLCPYIRQNGDEIRPPWYIPPRKLLDFLMVYVGSGHGIFTVGNETFPVEKDDLVWVPPDTIHEMRGTTEMHCIYLHFDLNYDSERSHWNACIPGGTRDLSEFKDIMHPPITDPVIKHWQGKLLSTGSSRLKHSIQAVCLAHARAPKQSLLVTSGLMLQVIQQILSEKTPSPSDTIPHRREMQDAATRIMERTGEEIDIAALAKTLGLSPSHFRALFRAVHGVSPSTMHRQARNQRACKLLAYTNMNVSEIAETLGYSNIHTFSRAFKQATSLSPSQYRSQG